jgi:hypothetical protein
VVPQTNSYDGDAASFSETETFQGVSGTTYTANGYHSAALMVQDGYTPCDGQDDPSCYDSQGGNWWDPFDFAYFGELDLWNWGATDYFSPGYGGDIPDSSATLGTTYDSASVSVASNACGDIRETMTAEYTSDHSPYHPNCAQYMSSTSWDLYFAGYPGIYDFNALTPDEGSSYQTSGWAILQPQLEIGLTYMGEQLGGQVFSITSGYRNPQAEIDAAKQNHTQPHMGSRHMAGDAADISTQDNSTFWLQVHDAGIQNGGCVEPVSGSTLSHLHVDWRMASTQFTGVGCAAAWKQ